MDPEVLTRWLRRIAWVGLLLSLVMPTGWGQAASPSLRLVRTNGAVSVSWTGRGTLQAASALAGPWMDLIEAPNPLRIQTDGSQQLFRGISRYGLRANLLEANSEMAVAELNGKIYVIGGYPSSRITVRTVQVYDPLLDRWQLTTPLPLGLNHSMAAAVEGRLYVIGGQTDAGSTSFVNSVFEFDPLTTNWTAKASMPTARSAGGAAVIGTRIYVAGGRPPRGQDFAVFDVTSNRWTTLPNMPTGRNHLMAAAIGGKVYVAGGRLGAGFTTPMTNVLEVFDPEPGSWRTRAPMPTTRGGVNGIATENCLLVWGGEGPNGVFDQNELYLPALDRWYRVESLPVAVHGVTGAALVNGWVHLPGGGVATGGSSGSTLHQVFWMGGLCGSAPVLVRQPASSTVAVGGAVFFEVEAVGSPPITYQWRKNGVEIPGAIDRVLSLGKVQESDAGAYAVLASNAFGGVLSSNAVLTVLPTSVLAQALDTPGWAWTVGGNAGWLSQDTQTHDGEDAAESAPLGHLQITWMETTVIGPGTLTFWWAVSSEPTYDVFELRVDGVLVGAPLSGESGWQSRTEPIPAGVRTLRWLYRKDGSFSQGQDRSWLDQVSFAPAAGNGGE